MTTVQVRWWQTDSYKHPHTKLRELDVLRCVCDEARCDARAILVSRFILFGCIGKQALRTERFEGKITGAYKLQLQVMPRSIKPAR